ncbi:MAG: replication-associated recombination protein A [Acidobacteriia bacterium]|nr:replication-associated recombination protein A [Terriglobia bacterium]MYG04465.1 replication-associated recombination protein A [Terriglobia bacterium]MYK10437.1 replication-associated recombination protein A [Terriglobia bacterium]
MRPRTADEFVGQQHLIGPGKPLRRQIEADELGSMILWGPPGVGKTSLARVIANSTKCEFVAFSGVLSSIKAVKAVLVDAERMRKAGRRTIVFVDEIHRFNKAQQDAFLPFVERGDIILIGATTENPSFEVISALLSRAKVYTLEPLTDEQLLRLQIAALNDAERGLAADGAQIPQALLVRIATYAGGDARVALLALEALARAAAGTTATEELLREILQRRLPLYDKQGEAHFNLISALHKSVRSSDPDAALYWLACMLEGGEDRLYIGRRLVRMAAEDIGLADPRAVEMAMAAVDAFRLVGEPEGDLFLAHVAVYLAVAPKSDAVYRALGEARSDVRTGPARQVPLHLRNAPTKLMRDQGYAEGYEHAHASDDALVGMSCLPEEMQGKRYYAPTRRGIEDRIAKRLEEILAARAKLRAQRSD